MALEVLFCGWLAFRLFLSASESSPLLLLLLLPLFGGPAPLARVPPPPPFPLLPVFLPPFSATSSSGGGGDAGPDKPLSDGGTGSFTGFLCGGGVGSGPGSLVTVAGSRAATLPINFCHGLLGLPRISLLPSFSGSILPAFSFWRSWLCFGTRVSGASVQWRSSSCVVAPVSVAWACIIRFLTSSSAVLQS